MNDVMVEVGVIQNALVIDKDITEVHLRSCWKGITLVHQAFLVLSVVNIFLLNLKSNEQDIIRTIAIVNTIVIVLERCFHGVEVLIRTIESECMFDVTRLNELYLYCSIGTGKQTGEAVAIHLRYIVAREKRLENVSSSFTSSVGSNSFGSTPIPPPSSIIDTKLVSFSMELALVRSSIFDLALMIGQDAIKI